MRMRRKPNLAARLERCAHLLVAEPRSLRGRWLCEFGLDELHVELGCGKGRFTVETAGASPNVLVAALEKSESAMVIALERAAAEGLGNVRFVNALAENLSDYFAPGEVSRLYINFCDPWPSNRHIQRRLTHQAFLELYKRVLARGGDLRFKTDNPALFDFSLKQFEKAGFMQLESSRNLHEHGPVGIMTDYEQKFHSQGLAIYYAKVAIQ